MAKVEKSWTEKNGAVLSDSQLRERAKTWGPQTWERFLKETVDVPQTEILAESDTLENIASDSREHYQDMLSNDEFPNLNVFVGSLIRKLSIREHEVIHSVFWLGLTQGEIAKQLGVRKAVVRTYQNRALKKLGELFVEKFKNIGGLDPVERGGEIQDFTQKPIGRRRVS